MKLKTITPVFVGSGDTYSGIDYFEHKGMIYFVDFNKILKSKLVGDYKKESEAIAQFITQNLKNNKLFNKEKFYDFPFINKILIDKLYFYSVPAEEPQKFKTHTNEIKAFTRSNFLPYIPGSSIKGALRTAILYDAVENIDFSILLNEWRPNLNNKAKFNLIKKFNSHLDRQFGSWIEKKYLEEFGSDFLEYANTIKREKDKPKFIDYFFNNLKVSDVFLSGKGIIMSPIRHGMTDSQVIVIEAFNGTGEVSLLSFLDFHRLKEVVNTHTEMTLDYIKSKIEAEGGSFEAELKITSILKEIEENEALFLLVGGYNGWYSKTLNLQICDSEHFDDVKKILELGKNPRNGILSRNFPKTYSLTKNDEVLGVIKINE
jgi:CRISPR-associated protein Csm5